LTTIWLLSNFQGSYHSIIVVQGVTHPSGNFTSLESG
jgi:hypothetical protein